jgi:hypothetical protein
MDLRIKLVPPFVGFYLSTQRLIYISCRQALDDEPFSPSPFRIAALIDQPTTRRPALGLSTGKLGNVRTQTLRAFSFCGISNCGTYTKEGSGGEVDQWQQLTVGSHSLRA